MDGTGTLSPIDLARISAMAKERLPIQAKVVEQLLDLLEIAVREARNQALEDAAKAIEAKRNGIDLFNLRYSTSAWLQQTGRYDALSDCADDIRAMKEGQ